MIKNVNETGLEKAFALLRDTLRNTHNTRVHQANLSKVLALLSDNSATPQGKDRVAAQL